MTAVHALTEPPPADFDALYETHVDSVWRLLQRFGVPEASLDDATQEVFVVAFRRLPEFRGQSSLKTWLLGIAVRIAKDVRRQRARKGGLEPLDQQRHLAAVGQPDETAMQRQALAQALALLDQLDEDQRTVLVLADFEELTAPEIAQATGVNLNTIYTRLRAARLRFNALLEAHQKDTP